MTRRSAWQGWFGRPATLLAWAIVIVAVLHPAHGTGVEVCLTKVSSGFPCLGCGMTRSVSCVARGMFAESVSYHALGIPLMLCASTIAGVSLLPRRPKRRLARRVMRHRRIATAAQFATLLAFVIFGVGRVATTSPLDRTPALAVSDDGRLLLPQR